MNALQDEIDELRRKLKMAHDENDRAHKLLLDMEVELRSTRARMVAAMETPYIRNRNATFFQEIRPMPHQQSGDF